MDRGYNLIPFSSINQMLKSPLGLKIGLYNIVGNFLMLTPLAVLFPLIDDRFKKVRNYFVTIILLSLIIHLTLYKRLQMYLYIQTFHQMIENLYQFYLNN